MRALAGAFLLAALVILVGAGCEGAVPGNVAGVPIRAFDLMGDTAVLLTDAAEPELLFVPVRGGVPGSTARRVELPYWGDRVTQLRTAGEWIFLGGAQGGVVLMTPEGERLLDREIVRSIPRGFAPGPDGVVYYAASNWVGFHTAAAGPARAGARPFARHLEPAAPVLSRARSGPGLDGALVVDREGYLVRFSNRTGVITRYAPDGSLVGRLAVPAELLSGAISRSRSGIGRPGGPLAVAIRLGCDGELVVTLGDRVRSVLVVDLVAGEVERVGALGARSGRIATLCDGRILAP